MKTVLKQSRIASVSLEDGTLTASLDVKLTNARHRQNAIDFCKTILRQVKAMEIKGTKKKGAEKRTAK